MSFGIAREAANSPFGSESDSKGKLVRKKTRVFLVKATSLNDGEAGAVNAVGIPLMWEPYVFGSTIDLECRVNDKSAERLADNALTWKVTVEYSTPDDDSKKEEKENPLLEKPEARIDSEIFQEAAMGTANDSEGGPRFEHVLKTSAGEPYIPPPPKDAMRHVLQITLNKPINYNIQKEQTDYELRVNSDAFFGYEAGKVRCNGITPVLCYKDLPNNGGTIEYLRVTYTFHIRDTWLHEQVDVGSYYIPKAGPMAGKKISFKNEDGQPRLGLLDGEGDALPDGDDPVWLPPVKLYKTKAFSGLNLPQTFADCKKFAR